jgi:hypothetical protein
MKNYRHVVLILFYFITILTAINAGTLWHHNSKSLDEDFERKSSTPSSKGDCEFNGEYYINGQIFMNDCNYCGCAYQQVTCTLLSCRTTVPK